MSDNPQQPSRAFFLLPTVEILRMQGTDAARFAQAQFMNDVNALAQGHWHWSGWLNPKGRLIALFALLKMSDEDILLLLPSGGAATLAQRLQAYIFRSKVRLEANQDWRILGSFHAPAHAAGSNLHGNTQNGWEMDFSGESIARCLRIAFEIPDVLPMDSDDLQNQWLACDLAHGLPHLQGDQIEAWTPQQLSLERLHAYSVKKGCYPGQEIVARTHFLGQAKRGLIRLHSMGNTLIPGTPLQIGEQMVGNIICSSQSEVLAVVSAPLPTGELSAQGNSVVALSFLDGLQR